MKTAVLASMSVVALALAGCSSVDLPTWDPHNSAPTAKAGTLPPDNLAPARNWTEYRLRAADRINRANPDKTFPGALPAVLRAIPVLRVHLDGDGRVTNIEVIRQPGQSPETVQMAKDAISRAAPFGPTSQLPAPAQFTETFLFNDQLQFRLRTTVEGR